MSNLGQSIPRHDGPIKVTGTALYSGDRNLPSQLYAVFVNATIPAGRVFSTIETAAALGRVGVVRVLKASDMPRVHRKLEIGLCRRLRRASFPCNRTTSSSEGSRSPWCWPRASAGG